MSIHRRVECESFPYFYVNHLARLAGLIFRQELSHIIPVRLAKYSQLVNITDVVSNLCIYIAQ